MDLQLNSQTLTTGSTSGTTAPASGTSETWTVAALGSGWPALLAGQTISLQDVTSGATVNQQSEIIRITASTGSTATSITVTRGADGTTPVGHSSAATFAAVLVASATSPPLDGVVPGGTGRYLALTFQQNQSGTYGNENVEICFGFYFPQQITIKKIYGWLEAAGGTGSVTRFGVRADNGTMLPGALILDFGTVATDSTGAVGSLTGVTNSTGATVGPGVAWISMCAQAAATSPDWMFAFPGPGYVWPAATSLSGFFNQGWAPGPAYNNTTVTGALPANTTSPAQASASQGINSENIPFLVIGT